ncbi:sporulation-specific protein 73 [Scheffersomyces amazonensis]|uniref:sporulation-specific protein 73 n=1 Tax=Scheffersomyces amazonensis TaxID=1078765 RepID=UPI00315D1A8E
MNSRGYDARDNHLYTNNNYIDDDEVLSVQLIEQLNIELTYRADHDNTYFSSTLKILNAFNSQISHTNRQFDFIIENQRGMKLFGIPLFSKDSLIPIIDPSNYQRLDGKDLILTNNRLDNYCLPDLDWVWCWENWYVLMYNDVDDQGWLYSNIFFSNSLSDKRWKGKYYFGNFIRRRIWVKLRKKVNSD